MERRGIQVEHRRNVKSNKWMIHVDLEVDQVVNQLVYDYSNCTDIKVNCHQEIFLKGIFD